MKKIIGGLVTLLCVIIGIIVLAKCTVRIKPGYAGVVYNMNGGIQDKVITQGWHIVSPFKHVTKYPISTEQAYLSKDKREGSEDDDSFDIPTNSGKTVNVDLEWSYRFDIEKLPRTFTQFRGRDGKDIEQTFIRGKIKSWSAEVSANYDILDVYGNKRSQLNTDALKHVQEKFEPYGIIIETLNFSRIQPDTETEKAIQQRVNSQQNLEKQKIELETAKIQADKAKVEAESKAQVVRIGAKAEAEANKLKQQTINDTVVKYEMVKKWDGKQSQVQGGNPIIDMRNSTDKK